MAVSVGKSLLDEKFLLLLVHLGPTFDLMNQNHRLRLEDQN